jgi:hypothetical protein
MWALRVKNVSMRLSVWTTVLYAALAMPFLGLILPSLSFEFPAAAGRLIPQSAVVKNALRQSAGTPAAEAFAPEAFPIVPLRVNSEIVLPKRNSDAPVISNARVSGSGVPSAKNHASFTWIVFLAATYISIALLFFGRLFLGMIFSRGLIRAARPIADSEARRHPALHGWKIGVHLPRSESGESAPGVGAASPGKPGRQTAGASSRTPYGYGDRPLRLAESELVSVPITLGILRPVILLPAEWREWSAAALRAVLAHERSHVIRRDALTQRLSLLHRAIFWFSPLSWWLHRCLADAAEEASDEAALLSGTDRAQYAETLLSFFAALQRAPRRVNWQGVSMAKAGQAEKRVDRILAWEGDVSMHLNKSLSISLLLFAAAVVLFTATARPSIAHAQNQMASPTPAQTPTQPVMAANPTPVAPPDPGVAPVEKAPALMLPEPTPPPAPPAVPAPDGFGPNSLVVPPIALQMKNEISDAQIQKIYRDALDAISRAGVSKPQIQEAVDLQLERLQRDGIFQMPNLARQMNWRGFDGGFGGRWVIVSGDSPVVMSGDREDVEHATSLRGKIKGDFVWFQRDEKSYVIRDRATVERAKALFKAEQEFGQKQDALGKQQEALGGQQRELGKKMEAVRVQIPDMSADIQKLEAGAKQLSAGGTQEQLGDLQRQMGELQRRIGESQFQAGDQQRQIGEQMRQLGQQQGELGRQQGELARQQMEASRQANQQMKQLLDDALARGTAQTE